VGREQPDFVVIVAHAAGDCEASCGGEMVELAAELDPGEVDLIVGGHRHTPGFGVVGGIPIIRAGSGGQAIGVLDLYRDADGSGRFEMRVDTAWADSTAQAPEMIATLEPHFQRADSLANLTIATLRDPLTRTRGEYPLGRLVSDAVRAASGAQVSLSNRGGVRADLDAGPVTYGELFRVKPFGNTIDRLELSGEQLRQVVEVAVAAPDFTSGIAAEYDPDAPRGQRVRSLTLEDGTPVTPDGRYTLATSNFISSGGDGYDVLAGLQAEPLGTTVLDALIAHVRRLPAPLQGPTDIRLREVR
jgi:5'-nucleotidase